MLRQAYRFVSILLVSNMMITQAGFAKTQENPSNPSTPAAVCQNEKTQKRTLFQRLFGLNKPCVQNTAEQKPVEQKPVVQKPQGYDNTAGITKYGVVFPDDFYGTYPSVEIPQNNKQ